MPQAATSASSDIQDARLFDGDDDTEPTTMNDSHILPQVENKQQFWHALTRTVSSSCATHESIDNVLRSWLQVVANYRDEYLDSEDEVARCSQELLGSAVFLRNKEYVRTQITYSLLQEDDFAPLHVIANFLLLDGRGDQATFRRMIDEGSFIRLLELVKGCREQDRRLHRLLLELMYAMSRIEQLRPEDLMVIDDAFIVYLFELIESISDDVNDPYHYPVIRVLLVLNEQYMVASTSAAVDPCSPPSSPPTNRVVKILSIHGPRYKTFSENIILVLNRETETALQLLILKLLYLLFTTRATYEYFYTNDLRVLLDVIIRNLLDLPNAATRLRHTYLRVLHPLLAHTQLSQPPYYKRDEILRLLRLQAGGGTHFEPADETTLRLVKRVCMVEWLQENNSTGQAEVAQRLLGMSISQSQSGSAVSVADVTGVFERPGVQTPSRKIGSDTKATLEQSGSRSPEERRLRTAPEVPQRRRGGPSPRPAKALPALSVDAHARKKQPPKVPPPRRRTRLAVSSTGEAVAAPEPLHSVVGSTPVP